MKRPPVDLWLVEHMLAANNGWCGCCGTKKLTLETCQRGHRIKRKPDGGNDGPDNVFPICAGCNKAHTLSEVTPADALRPDYLKRLVLRILARIPVEYHCNMVANHRSVVLTSQPTENSYVIDFKNSDFDAATEVYFWSARHGCKMLPDEAEKLVNDLITAAERAGAPAPTDRQRMISTTIDRGSDALQRVGRRVMREQMWRVDDRTDSFFWQRVFANFDRLEKLERLYENEQKERRRREREERLKAEEQAKVLQQERRCADYISALSEPDYPGMPDADREFKESFAIESEGLGEQALGVLRRSRLHQRDELLAEKQKLRDMLAQGVKWAKAYDADGQREYAARIRNLVEWIEKETSITELREHSWQVVNLYEELDPDRPRSDVDDF